jgi:hypothetical protein
MNISKTLKLGLFEKTTFVHSVIIQKYTAMTHRVFKQYSILFSDLLPYYFRILTERKRDYR